MLRGLRAYHEASKKYASYQRTLIPPVVASLECGISARIHVALR